MVFMDSISSQDLAAKARELLERLREVQPGLIAVSGGIDSRVLLAFALAAGLDFQPLFFSGPHLSPIQRGQGRAGITARGEEGRLLEVDPLQDEAVRENDASRCYHCKRLLFTRAAELARSLGRPGLLEGSHAGDLSAYRPGRRALRELGVASPLAEAGLNKQDIRDLAGILNLDQPDQASGPCLLTRFAYGRKPTHAELERIGGLEDELRELALRDFRLRVLEDGSRVLQIAEAEAWRYREKRHEVERALSRHGLGPCSIRIDSDISGFFDRR